MTHIMKINEMQLNNTSAMDVLKYICENLQNNIKIAKSLYSVQQKNGKYKSYDELVKINGIVYDNKSYWLLLEDDSKYQFDLIIELLNNGNKLEELLVI